MPFGVRSLKKIVFHSVKPDDSLDPVAATTKLLEKIKIDGPTGTDGPTQTNHAEENTKKSVPLEVRLS